MAFGAQVVVDRLTVGGAAVDTPALRVGLSGLLQRTDARPPGLPPAAILLVRHLSNPPEGKVALRAGGVHADAAWGQALRAQLGQLARRAARPQQGSIPFEAAAVLFADEGELLAALALDLSRGRALHCWWWRTLLRLLGGADLPGVLRHQVRAVPAIVAHLVGWEQEAAVAAALSPSVATEILQRVLRAYRIDWTPPAPAGIPGPIPHRERARQDLTQRRKDAKGYQGRRLDAGPGRDVADGATEIAIQGGVLAAPFPELGLSAAVGALAPAQQALLGVGLLLHRSPAQVRNRVFLQELSGWWQEMVSAPGTASQPRELPWAGAGLSVPMRVPEARGAEEPAGLLPVRVPNKAGAAEPDAPAAGSREDNEPEGGGAEEMRAAAHLSPAHPTALLESDGVGTQLGGLFYLLNLFEHLGLPHCCADLADHVGLWGLLEGVGRVLLAAAGDEWEDDPVWPRLAQLDGRERDERPGDGLPDDADFRLPPAWLRGVQRCVWTASDGRLCLWTEDPFLLVDVACAAEAAEPQAQREALPYRVDQVVHTRHRPPIAPVFYGRSARADRRAATWFSACSPGYLDWLAHLVPYLRVWLHRALGVPLDESDRLVASLLRCPGTLYVTTTHLDLVMSLEQISLPVRVAGLDRSPGWLPSVGRVVTFHFE